jgi:hypothetical protein
MQDYQDLTRSAFRILHEWQVPVADWPRLLGLSEPTHKRDLSRYRLGYPLPDDPSIRQRLLLINEIDHALHSFFPHSGTSGRLWMTTPRRRFGGITPLEIVLTRDIEGMELLLDVLNGQVGL